ncbi:hypothetical protein BGZ68_005057 [Mortierella alpina]|nr:hypothetical protein BGZ68_005057 [Mortierella alpina]
MADSNARYRLRILAGPGSDRKSLRPLQINNDSEPMIIDTDEFHGYVTFRIKDLDKVPGYAEGQKEDGMEPVPNSKWFDLPASGTKSKNRNSCYPAVEVDLFGDKPYIRSPAIVAMNLIHASPLTLQSQDAQVKTADEEKLVPPWTSPNGEHVLENTCMLFEALDDQTKAVDHPQQTSLTTPTLTAVTAPAAPVPAARSSRQRQHFFAKPKNLTRHRYQPDQMYDFEFTSAGPYLDFANFKLKIAGFSIDLLRFWDGQIENIGEMFDSHFWPRNALSLREIAELASLFLKFAQSTDNINALLLLCGNVGTVLSAMKHGVRKTLHPSASAEDQELCENIASIFTEHGKLWERLENIEKARSSFKKAEKWSSGCSTSPLTPGLPHPRDNSTILRKIAHVAPEIFPHDVILRPFKPKPPASDARICSTPQLVYCLALLSSITSVPPAITAIDETLDEVDRNWLQSIMEDADEQNRLRSLAGKMIAEFMDDDLKETAAVAEVVTLAPVVSQANYRKLLETFISSIKHATLLEFELLDGIAQLILHARGGYLQPADLVSVLNVLSTRLQDTHQQSSTDLYALVKAVSNVLDAMADCDVKGLSRETMHEPLSRYLDGLKDNPDLYLVYHAAYAYQALQYIPDDESSLQSVLRRARVVVSGVSGMVSAVKGLDLNKFLTGLEDIQDGLAGAYQVVKAGVKGIAAAVELVENGTGLLDSLKEGLSFSHKCAWYPALRGSDTFIRNGQLSKFRRLVCEAPCRRDAAFQLGVCQRLGEVAANPSWDDSTRQQAVDFLCELYKDDAEWGKHVSCKKWILAVLERLTTVPNKYVKEYALAQLKVLETSGAVERQELYRAHRTEATSSFPLEAALQMPLASPLLIRAQEIPDVEEDLRRLRKHQLQDRSKAVYIPPRAKANREAADSTSFDLMENMRGFLKSNLQVFLLLGDSGAGKSTFNRELECVLWSSYSGNEDDIPLFIHLPSIDNPEKDLVAKHLRRCDFLEPQIRELKNTRRFTLICDGYDECQQIYNLYTSNKLNEDGQWQAKMVISCRSEHLGHDYRDRFQPPTDAATSHGAGNNRLQEAVIIPFSTDQIHDYIHRHVADVKPPWRAKSYITALENIPNLMDLIKNPFLLRLSLDVLPGFVDVDKIQELSNANITRVGLYDRFVEHWLERGKKRVGNRDLSQQSRAAFDTIVDEGFIENGIDFLKRLAAAIYKEQAGHPIIEYSRFKDEETWKARFFNRDDESRLLREACPLIRSGNQYRFVHKSLLEYCLALAVFDPQVTSPSFSGQSVTRRGSVSSVFSFDGQTAPEGGAFTSQQAVLNSPLGWRSFVDEPSILQFLAERVQQEPSFKQQLLAMIEHSKTNKDGRIAAANAITILVRAGTQFIEADLRGIRIPGADLSFGMFEGAQLQRADMRKANLHNIWLHQADLSDSRMTGVQFGEWPYLQENCKIRCIAYSPDGKSLVAGFQDNSVVVYDTMTWTKIHTLHGHTKDVNAVAYASDGLRIASGSRDGTVRLWDTLAGVPVFTLNGHTDDISAVVFSPSGHHIASASEDKTVRVSDTQTGAIVITFTAHTDAVLSLAYSPCGHQIASGSWDTTVRLWNAVTGEPGLILTGHTDAVRSVAYSPSGHQIVSGSEDTTVRTWDAQTGCPGHTLSGHSHRVYTVAFSPSGHQIASGSSDTTVRLWDVQTGAPGPILTGHFAAVLSVRYSPSGHQIASSSADTTIRLCDTRTGASRSNKSGHATPVVCVAWSPCGTQIASAARDYTVLLWNAQTGASGPILYGHTGIVKSVMYSPSGHQIASVSEDMTLRLWDAQSGASGLVLHGHGSFIESVAYSPSGHQLASGGYDETVRLWDAQTGASGPILTGHTGAVFRVAYSPSGHQLASCGAGSTVRLWDAQTGALMATLGGYSDEVSNKMNYFPDGRPDMDWCLRYSPSGHQIATGSKDKIVRIWNVGSGACVMTLCGHTADVLDVAYSSDGHRIASCSTDGSVRLWDVSSGACIASLDDVNKFTSCLAWRESDAGSYLATGNSSLVRMWRVSEEGGKPCFSLQWSTPHSSLNVKDVNIQNAEGLNRMQIQLLKQRGIVGEPTPPLSIPAAGERLISMADTVNRWSKASRKALLEDLAVEPLAGKAEMEVSWKRVQHAIEE